MFEVILCQCGCGRPAPIAKKTYRERQHVRGRPIKYIQGHNAKNHKCIIDKPIEKAVHISWRSMIQRCTNSKHRGYRYYGGKGIVICCGLRDFPTFIKVLGDRPDGHTLDRINSNLGYWCGQCNECIINNWNLNCRWATPKEQARDFIKTYCIRGHEMIGDNIYITPSSGERSCRACKIIRHNQYKQNP